MGAAMRARRVRARAGERIHYSPRRARRAWRTDRAGAIGSGECRSGGAGVDVSFLGASGLPVGSSGTNRSGRWRYIGFAAPAGGDSTGSGAVRSPDEGRRVGWRGFDRVRGGEIPGRGAPGRLAGIPPRHRGGSARSPSEQACVGVAAPGDRVPAAQADSGPAHYRSVLSVHSAVSGETAVTGSAGATSGRGWPVRPFPSPASTPIVDTMEMPRFSLRLR
jgi:hypothetical protein